MEDKVEFVREMVQMESTFALPTNPSMPTESLDGTMPNPELEEKGLQLLRENKVAVLMVAGGTSTRMGITELKGNIPIGPVTQRSIFRLQGEKIAAIRQRYAPGLPWLVMTSREVHNATVASFVNEGYFGVPPDKIWFFQQTSFPVLDAEENPIMLPRGEYLESPCGHGGMLEALQTSGILSRLHNEGIEYLFYFQYPNVLENICDPVMLGYHHAGQSDVTTKAITDYLPEEELGKCVEVDGNLQIIEYHFLKDKLSDSWWNTVPANVGTHVWSISFLVRCLKNNVTLPFHVVSHSIPSEAPKPLKKIERFIFDLLPYSSKKGLMIVAGEEECALIRTKQGIHSIDSGRSALIRLYYNWLIKAGAIPAESDKEWVVEISPKFALNYEELKSKIYPGFPIYHNMVLSDNTEFSAR